jgi:hypothetical protein
MFIPSGQLLARDGKPYVSVLEDKDKFIHWVFSQRIDLEAVELRERELLYVLWKHLFSTF